jgi:hypothetical protein
MAAAIAYPNGRLVSVLCSIFSMAAVTFGQGVYPYDVFFVNSLTEDSYFYSQGSFSVPSRLELVNGRFPIDQSTFFNPPNALRLKWMSKTPGDWDITLRLDRSWGRSVFFAGSVLSFWCYAEKDITPGELPAIYLRDFNGLRTPPLRLAAVISSIPARTWIQVKIPLDSFDTSAQVVHHTDVIDLRRLMSISFCQSIDDGVDHTLYIDEVKIYDPVSDAEPPAMPKDLKAKAFDRHIDLRWESNKELDLQGYIVYRSFDGKAFQPIATQDARFHTYSDFIGEDGRIAFYKVSAFDVNYNESQPTHEVTAETHAMSDDELLSMVQEASFRYYWDSGHPIAGLALEHLPVPQDEHLVAIGASGFGIMATVVAMERGFITRQEGAGRLLKSVNFLEKADRFHGVWPHFVDGRTGKVIPRFGKYDNGGDLIETAFLIEGLLVARQYFKDGNELERAVSRKITRLWETVEWDWYGGGPDSNFLYWHWSPEYQWHINHPVVGWNEAMIVYLLAIASPTHPVPAKMYYTGWAGQSELAVRYRQNWGKTSQGDHYANGNTYYGIKLDVGVGRGGALWFTHYSFMGFDPRDKKDRYTNYFRNSRNMALIHHAYCIENPNHYAGYGEQCWGVELSSDPTPKNDRGIISPTQALGSFPYTPEESMNALKYFYRERGSGLWGIYGFRDAFSASDSWVSSIYMGLDEGPITVMIENYRSGLIWRLFMSNPEIQPMLKAIGFVKD